MIKKYLVEKESTFNKSIMLPFYEGVTYGFTIDGLSIDERFKLFDFSKVKNVGKNIVLSSNCYAIYLDDNFLIKALVIEANIDKKIIYYCLRGDSQNDKKLRYQTNYKSEDVNKLLIEFEKSGPCKKDQVVPSKFSEIKDLDYFKQKYSESISKQVDKDSSVSRLVFQNPSKFLSDFARLVERDELKISAKDGSFFPKAKIISQNIIQKNRFNRQDCLLINVDNENIEYFVYTFSNKFTNHYYLFKFVSNKEYVFIAESTCFEQLLLENLKELKYKNHTFEASKALENVSFNDFIKEYIEFKNDEAFDESFEKDFEVFEHIEQIVEEEEIVISPMLDALLKKFNYRNEAGVLFFDEYEPLPLGFIEREYINFVKDRETIDENQMIRLPLKNLNKVQKYLVNLLQELPSSRVLYFKRLIEKTIKHAYSKDNNEQLALISQIEDAYKTMWPTDRNYQSDTIRKAYNEFLKWKENSKKDVVVSIEDKLSTINSDVGVTLHAMSRIDERIKKMSDEDKTSLAKVAYEKGKNSAHYYGVNNDMFMFLQYKQNKYPDKTLRLYEDVIFIFGLKPPHALITCFPLNKSFEEFMKHRHKN